jgi:hypothetical protein
MWPTKGDPGPGYRTGNAPPMPPHPWHLNPAAYQNMSNEQGLLIKKKPPKKHAAQLIFILH